MLPSTQIFVLAFFATCCSGATVITNVKTTNYTLQLEDEYSDNMGAAILRNENMMFLGKYGTKNFYVFTTPVNQETARARCTSEGYRPLQFDTQAEVDFVNSKTTIDFCWTDAIINYAPTSFKWFSTGQFLADGLRYEQGASVGLTLSKYSGYGVLSPRLKTEQRCYYCYQRVVPKSL